MVLDKELATFQRELPRLLLDHEGEFALVHGDRVDSLWKMEDEAYVAGCDRFGVEPFLVKKVQRTEQPIVLFVDVNRPCPP